MRLLSIWSIIFAVLLIRIDDPFTETRAGYTAAWADSGYTSTWADPERDRALACLAANVYMESRGEPKAGQIAVAHVVMTRAKWKIENVCGVVFAKDQFSWTRSKNAKIRNVRAFRMAYEVSKKVLRQRVPDYSGGADHYHANYVSPAWAKADCLTHKVTIGRHIFFKCIYGRYKSS